MIRSDDIEKFIKQNLPNFSVNGTGWNELIQKMLFEFCIAGWDTGRNVGGKEKFGELRCSVILEDKNLEKKIKDIIDKYAAIAAITCEQCASPARLRVDQKTNWHSTLCKECYFKQQIQTNNYALSKEDKARLRECKICGYIAILDSSCRFCHNAEYLAEGSFAPSKYYASEEEYVKVCQMEMYLDEDNEIELSKKVSNFSKSPSHCVIFSIDDLCHYNESRKDH